MISSWFPVHEPFSGLFCQWSEKMMSPCQNQMLIKTVFAQILLNSLTNYCSHQWGKSSRPWKFLLRNEGTKTATLSVSLLRTQLPSTDSFQVTPPLSPWRVLRQTDGQTNRACTDPCLHPIQCCHCLQWDVITHFRGVSTPYARHMKQVQLIRGLATVDNDTDCVELHWWQTLYREISCLTWGWLKPRVYKPVCKQCVV